MRVVVLPETAGFEAWRRSARRLARGGVPPQEVVWRSKGEAADLFGPGGGGRSDGQADLDADGDADEEHAEEDAEADTDGQGGRALTVPSAFPELARAAACHRDPARFSLLYRLLWRLQDHPRLMRIASDLDVARLEAMARAVRRDCHKMTAFVRFREMRADGSAAPAAIAYPPAMRDGRRRFFAWFEPDHHIVERTAPFFARRFATMDWTIATPKRCATWDGARVTFTPGLPRPPETEDALEELWRTYYAHIFNPARLKVKAMQAEMPKKYWRNLPEAELIPGLVAGAQNRVDAMVETGPGEPPKRAARIRMAAAAQAPDERRTGGQGPGGLDALAGEAAGCTRCPLHDRATQTVFGEGGADSRIMVVGEQPGDREDLAGRPFVGPAGRLFDACLAEAGIDRKTCYVTNAVKHFKYVPRGKRRIHHTPNAGEIAACRWWLDRERAVVGPELILALGATAAHALTGRGDGIMKRRGTVEEAEDGTPVFLTVHPSFLLRIREEDAARAQRRLFVADLERLAGMIGERRGAGD